LSYGLTATGWAGDFSAVMLADSHCELKFFLTLFASVAINGHGDPPPFEGDLKSIRKGS